MIATMLAEAWSALVANRLRSAEAQKAFMAFLNKTG